MAWSPYAAGRKIYRSGSTAPTQGTVNPMGYITRSLTQQSTRRSGLAAAALRRTSTARPRPAPAVKPSVSPRPSVLAGPTGKLGLLKAVQTRANAAKPPKKTAVKTPPKPAAPKTTTPVIPPTPTTPAPATPGTPEGQASLPYDAEANDQRLRLAREQEDYLANLDRQRQAMEQTYAIDRRSAEIAEPAKLRQLLNAYAARGAASSTGYSSAYGDEQAVYANMLANIEGAKATKKSELEQNQTDYTRTYNDRLAQIFWDQSRRIKAGEAGIGTVPKAPGAAKPKSAVTRRTDLFRSVAARRIAPKKPTLKKKGKK